jgi:glycosyltransferase involved in cell wall biosynthesis
MADPDATRLRVLFVCLNDFRDASAKQALWFGQELARRGHEVMLSVGGDPASARDEGAQPDSLTVRGHGFRGPLVNRADVATAAAFAPDVIHCWNPRLGSVTVTRRYAQATGAPVVVHWEDDEWRIRSDPMGRSLVRRALRPAKRVAARLQPSLGVTMDERSRRWIAAQAAGLDALTPALAEHVAARMGRACEVILPVTGEALSGTGEAATRQAAALGGDDELGAMPVALWTGSVHPGLEVDVRTALAAVAEVQRRGHELGFVHVGEVLPRYDTGAWIREAGLRDGTARFLGYVPYTRIPSLLAGARILLSSGAPSDYNRLRLPSKVQAYLASGTPTITFATGFGELLRDREEALLTTSGDATELAGLMIELLDDPELAARLQAGGPQAAARLFDSERNTAALLAYYRQALR